MYVPVLVSILVQLTSYRLFLCGVFAGLVGTGVVLAILWFDF